MPTSYQARREEARQRAEDKFKKIKQREEVAQNDREKAYTAVVSKMARLRALRLAKESSDKEAADRAAADEAESKAQSKAARVAKKAAVAARPPATDGDDAPQA